MKLRAKSCTMLFILILLFFTLGFDSKLAPQSSGNGTKVGDELRVSIVEKGEFSSMINPYQGVFSSEESLRRYYAKMKDIPINKAYNPGINLNYNMAVIIGLGEVYREGYEIHIDKAVYTGKTVEIHVRALEPQETDERSTRSPYIIASIENDTNVRKNIKLIKFIQSYDGKLIKSLPVRQMGRYPFYEIPDKIRIKKIEQGDYCNVGIEAYGAFAEHHSFEHTYSLLKEDGIHRIRPPELSFLGNIIIIMTMGEKEDGGYSIDVNGAYTNTYMMGDSVYIMVRKNAPTLSNIRYYETTRPYMIGSLQVGVGYSKVKQAVFINEITGKILVKKKIVRNY